MNSLIVPKIERSDLETTQMGVLSGYLSQYLPLLVPKLAAAGVSLVGIQQLRDNIGQMYGSPTTVSGGRAWKHFVSLAINLTPKNGKDDQIFDAAGAKMGTTVEAYISKSKCWRPFLKGTYRIVFGEGFVDTENEILDVGVRKGIITKPNQSSFMYKSESGQEFIWKGGEDKAAQAIKGDPALMAEMLRVITAAKHNSSLEIVQPVDQVADIAGDIG